MSHPPDVCHDPACEPCVAQRLYDADRAAQAQQLAEGLRMLADAVLAPLRWLLNRLARTAGREG